jgi:hypothetical protein
LAAAALEILARDGSKNGAGSVPTWHVTFSTKSGLVFEIACAGPDLPRGIEPTIATGALIAKERGWTGTYRLVVRASRLIVLDLHWKIGEPTRIMGFSRGDWEFDLIETSMPTTPLRG